MTIEEHLELLKSNIGIEQGPTAWREVKQSDMNAFGGSTYDPDPMHVDPEWATKFSPFGGTIAFGFWTLGMLTSMYHELHGGGDGGEYGQPHEERIGVNYGFERLRFIEPVPVGARIRLRSTLFGVEQRGPDRLLSSSDVVIDIENEPRPALSARWLTMLLIPQAGQRLEGFRRSA